MPDNSPDASPADAAFEAHRARLQSVAYRTLGSQADADDAVQEAWLRLNRADAASIDSLGAWLTTVVSRICLDRLRARTAHAQPTDPEVLSRADGSAENDTPDPLDEVLIADSVGAALTVVLDRLGPAERVAFVLHDVFGIPLDQVAGVIDKSPDATRQLASRARRRVQGGSPLTSVDLVVQREAVEAFLRAAKGGDFDGLVALLAPDVELRPDAAALRMGSLQPTAGAAEVGALLAGGAQSARVALVDGVAALVWAPTGDVRGVISFTVADGKIAALDVTGDADRIAAMDIVLIDDV